MPTSNKKTKKKKDMKDETLASDASTETPTTAPEKGDITTITWKESSKEDLEALELKFLRAKNNVYEKYPFFFHILQQQRFLPTDDPRCPTMAVDPKGNIYCNIQFGLKELTSGEFLGVLLHECMHLCNFTFAREGNRSHTVWNWATDYIINRDLKTDGVDLPGMALIPVDNVIKADQLTKMLKCYGIVKPKKKVKDIDVKDKACEYVYDVLWALIPDDKKVSMPVEGPSIPEDGSKGMDNHLKGGEEGEGYVPHKDCKVKPNTKDKSMDRLKSEIQGAETFEKHSKHRGTTRGAARRSITDLLKPVINWREVLKTFINHTKHNYTYLRPSRRSMVSGYYGPRIVKEPTIDVVVAIDTSGSITDHEYRKFVTEIIAITRSASEVCLRLIYWNAEVYGELVYNSQRDNSDSILNFPLESGGTTMSSVSQYITSKAIKPKGVIYFTDGCVEERPEVPNCRKIFILNEGGHENIVSSLGDTYIMKEQSF